MSASYNGARYGEAPYNAGPLPQVAQLYRTTYTCYPRHDERWENGSEHELLPDVAFGLNLIYLGLLVPADGTLMPSLPVPGTMEHAQAIQAARRAIVYAQRSYGPHAGRGGARRTARDTAG